MSTVHYTYLAPGYIRLLRILPDVPEPDDDNQIRCEITTVRLEDGPDYTALSYTWGGEHGDDTINIELNGKPHRVRKNLRRFLHQAKEYMLASRPLFKLIWIDAVCINQTDLAEREQQVSYMPEIYGRASRVLVWLGPAYNGSDVAMDSFAKPFSTWARDESFYRAWTNASAVAIRQLCYRPYWSRLWIFQELMLAQSFSLMCGAQIIAGDRFCDIVLRLADDLPPSRNQHGFEVQGVRSSPALSILQQIRAQSEGNALWDLMHATQDLHCSDPRDKVYGLLGVAKQGSSQLSANYNTSVARLLHDVLRNQHALQPPADEETVAAQCESLALMLGESRDLLFSYDRNELYPLGLSDHDIDTYSTGLDGSFCDLWWCLANRHHAVADMLWERNFVDGQYLLTSAIRNGHDVMARFLLSTGKINVNAEDKIWQLPLICAASSGREELARLLLDRGANLHAADSLRQTPLGAAIMFSFDAEEPDWDKCGILQVKSIDVNIPFVPSKLEHADYERFSEDPYTVRLSTFIEQSEPMALPLNFAAEHGLEELGRILIERGANLNAVDDWKRTPLLAAIRGSQSKFVELILELNNQVEKEGDSWWLNPDYQHPLKIAVWMDNCEILGLLLHAGIKADPDPEEQYRFFKAAVHDDGSNRGAAMMLLSVCIDRKHASKRAAQDLRQLQAAIKLWEGKSLQKWKKAIRDYMAEWNEQRGAIEQETASRHPAVDSRIQESKRSAAALLETSTKNLRRAFPGRFDQVAFDPRIQFCGSERYHIDQREDVLSDLNKVLVVQDLIHQLKQRKA